MQASQQRDSEELLKAIQLEHKKKVEGLVVELEKVSLQQAGQLKEIAELRQQARATWERREKELTDKQEREMRVAIEEHARQAERCRSEVTSAKQEMEREMKGVIERHRTELEAIKSSLMGEEKERAAAEMQRWVERERDLQEKMKLKEQSLAQRVADLSEELRTAKDQLAVARQRITEMEEQLEVGQSEVHRLCGEREGEHQERERLREQVASLQNRVNRAEEEGRKWREKLSEKEGKIPCVQTVTLTHVGRSIEFHYNRCCYEAGGKSQTGSVRAGVSAVRAAEEVRGGGEGEGDTSHAAPLLHPATLTLTLLH